MSRVFQWPLSGSKTIFTPSVHLRGLHCVLILTKMSFFGTSTTTNTSATAEKDIEMADPPTDSISSMSFSSQADYLAVGSWDNSVSKLSPLLYSVQNILFTQVRIYEVLAGGQTTGKAMYQHQGPVLSVCWNKAPISLYFLSRPRWIDSFFELKGRKQNSVRWCRQRGSNVWCPDGHHKPSRSTRCAYQEREMGRRTVWNPCNRKLG